MLAKEELDAVYISIPPFAHGAPEKAVVAAGLPMFVEKPVHMDADEAKEIAAQVEDKGIITACGYQERYLDIIDKAQELLASRRVGFFMGYWMGGMPGGWWREKAKSGGQLMEQTTHEFDMARYLFGEVKPSTLSRDMISFLILIMILRKRLQSLCNLRAVCLGLCFLLASQPTDYGVLG